MSGLVWAIVDMGEFNWKDWKLTGRSGWPNSDLKWQWDIWLNCCTGQFFQCITVDISTWQQDLKKPIIPMTLTEIGWPHISGGCPYKVVNSQWVLTRAEAMMRNEQMNEMCTTLHLYCKVIVFFWEVSIRLFRVMAWEKCTDLPRFTIRSSLAATKGCRRISGSIWHCLTLNET